MYHLIGIHTFFDTWKTFFYFYNFKIPKEFWYKVIITLFLIFFYRIGSYIPLPGININILNQIFLLKYGDSNIINQINLLMGGSLSRMSIFSLHLIPYLVTNLLFNLIFNNLSFLKKIKKERQNNKKLDLLIQISTFFIAFIQSIFILYFLKKLNFEFLNEFGLKFLISENIYVDFIIITTLIIGTLILQWIGNKIEKYGLGNGITIILFSGIVSEISRNFWEISLINKVFIFFIFFILLYIIITIEEASISLPIVTTQSLSIWSLKESISIFFYILIPLNFFNIIPIIIYHFLINFRDFFGFFFFKTNIF